jgi:hypothetical protein
VPRGVRRTEGSPEQLADDHGAREPQRAVMSASLGLVVRLAANPRRSTPRKELLRALPGSQSRAHQAKRRFIQRCTHKAG